MQEVRGSSNGVVVQTLITRASLNIELTVTDNLRKLGLECIDQVPWGTHFCQFYGYRKDLLDILVSYFRAGLENNEFCMWITAQPLEKEDAIGAMEGALPGFREYLGKGQIELCSHEEWYKEEDKFHPERVINKWEGKLHHALAKGYQGVRSTGNLSWVGKKDWKAFADYERRVNRLIGNYRMICLCTYPYDRCGTKELIDVLKNHHFALFKRDAGWETTNGGLTAGLGENHPKAAASAVEELEETKQCLRRSREKYAQLLELVKEGIWIIDAKSKTTFVNNPMAAMLGYTPEEMIGQHIFSFMDEQGKEVARRNIQLRKQGIRGHYDLEFIRRDGKRIYTIISASPIIAADGTYGGSVGLITDLTDRKEAEEALRKSEERYRGLVENVRDVIFTLSSDGTLTSLNAAFEEVTGWSRVEWMGKSFAHIVHPDDLLLAIQRLQEALQGEVPQTSELRVLSKSGEHLVGEFKITPQREHGKVVGVLGIGRDVTERKRAAEKLESTLDTLRNTLGGMIQIIASIIEARDPYTAGHQRRVSDLARAIATEMGVPKEQVDGIRVAGVIHDLGKIAIPSEILIKPGQISKHEFALIKSHPEVAYEILKGIKFPWPIDQIVLQHHERLDGSGYPHGLVGEEIRLEARILAVADVVEAMATHRPYRPALGITEALGEITQNKGTLYDSDAVDACVELFTEKGYTFPKKETSPQQ